MTMTVENFYDEIAPFYHLIFGEWESSIERQATALDSIIKEFWGAGITTIVDLACGTEHRRSDWHNWVMITSDLSSSAIRRAGKLRRSPLSDSPSQICEGFRASQAV
jgi:hypothetical protein